MARVLMVGIDPAEVDYSDPSLPPGLTADIVRGGIKRGMDNLRAAGHEPQQLYIPLEPDNLIELAEKLAAEAVDCVTIGGGVRLPPRNLALFEAVINVVAAAVHRPVIALVSAPDQAAASVERVLKDKPRL